MHFKMYVLSDLVWVNELSYERAEDIACLTWFQYKADATSMIGLTAIATYFNRSIVDL